MFVILYQEARVDKIYQYAQVALRFLPMGYMGFGLQKWIYSIKPRKAFSRERKPIGNTLPKYQRKGAFDDESIHLTGRIKQEKSLLEIQEEKESKRYNKILRILIYCFVLVMIIVLAINYGRNSESRYQRQLEQSKRIESRKAQEKRNAYYMVYEFGQNHINNKQYDSAIKEFEHLIFYNPDSITAREALANALYLACLENNIECDRAINAYEELLNERADDLYVRRCAEIHIHQGDFEKADAVLNKIGDINKRTGVNSASK